MHSSVQVLLLGNAVTTEMAPILAAVSANVPAASLRRAIDVAVIRAWEEQDGWFPDLIVVCQNWPDEFSGGDVYDLMRLFPLARLVCCFGVWCDSDGRTRSIWPLAVRVPAIAAALRIERELEMLNSASVPGTAAFAGLALTASRREIFDFEFAAELATDGNAQSGETIRGDGPPNDEHLHSLRVTVISPDRAWLRMVEAAVIWAGYCFTDRIDETRADVILWDADPWYAGQSERLRALREQSPRAACIAFLGFPRPELMAEVQEAGADLVCFKLAQVAVWLGELKTVANRSPAGK